jgi:methyl-accepting chemotaxis protein
MKNSNNRRMPEKRKNYWLSRLAEKASSFFFIKKFGHTRKRAREIPPLLSDLIGSLEDVCRDAEPNFMRLGRELESVYSEADDLTQHTFETVRRIGGESNQGVLIRAGELARQSFSNFRTCHRQVAENLDHVSAIIRYLGELHGACATLAQIGMFLRAIGFNIGVESSRTANSSDMFTVVSQQIRELSEKITEIGRNIRESTEATQSGQISVHSKISGGLDQLETLADETREAVENSVLKIEQLMEFSLNTLEEAGTHTREISRQVGEIVAGIQIHDSMTQRVQHIVHALHKFEMLVCPPAGSRERGFGKDMKKRSLAYSILNLQREHLKQIIADVDRVYQKTIQAFGRIHSEIDRLTHSLSSFGFTRETENSPEEDSFSGLRSALLRFHELLEQGNSLVERIHKTATEATDTASNLSGHINRVREISFETHLLALNAIVKAAHLHKEGRSLEVLAQEVKNLSDQSKRFVRDVTLLLEQISDSVRKMGTGLLDSSGSDETEARDIGIEDISRAYTQFMSDSSKAVQRAQSLNTSISQIISGLEFFPDLSRELKAHLCQLEELAELLDVPEAPDMEMLIAETDKLAQKYTMQQERGIHENFLDYQEQNIFQPSSDAADTPARDTDESFTDTGPENGQASELPDNDDYLGDNVELF